MHKVTVTWQRIVLMLTSFVLIPDERKEDRWFRAGTLSCMANLSVPLKLASHCLLVSKEVSETHEGGMGDKEAKLHQCRTGRMYCLESCRRMFKCLSLFFKEPWVQSPPVILSLDSLAPNPDLKLSLLLGSPDSCVGTPSGFSEPV